MDKNINKHINSVIEKEIKTLTLNLTVYLESALMRVFVEGYKSCGENYSKKELSKK